MEVLIGSDDCPIINAQVPCIVPRHIAIKDSFWGGNELNSGGLKVKNAGTFKSVCLPAPFRS